MILVPHSYSDETRSKASEKKLDGISLHYVSLTPEGYVENALEGGKTAKH